LPSRCGQLDAVAERLAGLGHVAIVPDFYHRTAPGFAGTADERGRAEGYALLNRLDRDEVRADLMAVLAHPRQRADTAGGTGMVGFSLGGHLAYFAATQVPLAAAAVVYPGWLDVTGTALSAAEPLLALTPGIAAQGGSVLYLVGADDHVVTADQTRLAAEALAAASVPHEVVVHPDTPHGFLDDERDTFRPARPRTRGAGSALSWRPDRIRGGTAGRPPTTGKEQASRR
jgi:carboxymethylenebutenolidase